MIKRMIKKKIAVEPVWQLNHLQKPFTRFQNYKITNATRLIEKVYVYLLLPF